MESEGTGRAKAGGKGKVPSLQSGAPERLTLKDKEEGRDLRPTHPLTSGPPASHNVQMKAPALLHVGPARKQEMVAVNSTLEHNTPHLHHG